MIWLLLWPFSWLAMFLILKFYEKEQDHGSFTWGELIVGAAIAPVILALYVLWGVHELPFWNKPVFKSRRD